MFKYLYLIIFTTLLSLDCLGQRDATKVWGTVLIDKNISMNSTEVSIIDWIGFIVNNDFDSTLFPNYQNLSSNTKLIFEDLKQSTNFKYIKIVDNWGTYKKYFGLKGIRFTKKFKELIKNDTNNYSISIPITGITYEQALLYCNWKEKLINSSSSIKIRVSLPSIEIYERVLENRDSINPQKCYTQNSLNCNCLSTKNNKDFKSQGKSLVRVDGYWPSKLGLYNLQGNASEMTSIKGVAMGGSYINYARDSFKDKRQYYSKSEYWLGFRFIVRMP